MEYIFALDVGGTTISGAALDVNNNFLSSVMVFPAHSHLEMNQFVVHLHSILSSIQSNICEYDSKPIGISMAFPGPFDYEGGVPLMKNLGKFNLLHGVNLRDALTEYLFRNPLSNQPALLPIKFENDAKLCVLGEYLALGLSKDERLMGITLGTGCGSAFILNSNFVSSAFGIPEDGMIYHLPFKNSIIDDYISKRGILNIAEEFDYRIHDNDLVHLYHAAVQGNSTALDIFKEFGARFFDAIKPFLDNYKPDVLVIGGQISKSYDFFNEALTNYASENTIKIVLDPASSRQALTGANHYFYSSNK